MSLGLGATADHTLAATQSRAMPSNRMGARLSQLPHNVLADLAAQLCSESPALQAAAEECMAAHNPLPHEMVERVLLSPDLVPHILGPLEAEDGAAAAVCSQWLAGWKATNEPRRRLKQVPLDLPEELVTCSGLSMDMAVTPDGRLVVRAGEGGASKVGGGSKVHILDRSMRVPQTVADDSGAVHTVDGWQPAASDDSIVHCRYDLHVVHRCTYDGTAAAEFQLEGYDFRSPVLAPGGLLFCVIDSWGPQGDTADLDEIVALDAQTLQLRHRFGLGLLGNANNAGQLAVGGGELYVCDTGNDRLQVFSLTGEHRRSIVGEWRSPQKLCFAKDRLYLVEEEDEQERRILVLSLQGDILQVVMHPAEPTAHFHSICCFDHRLLAACHYYTDAKGLPLPHDYLGILHRKTLGILALQGL